MPSNSRNELQRRPRDVDEIISAHTAITGGGKGKPVQQQGGTLTRAGVVLLSRQTQDQVGRTHYGH